MEGAAAAWPCKEDLVVTLWDWISPSIALQVESRGCFQTQLGKRDVEPRRQAPLNGNNPVPVPERRHG